MTRRDIHEPSDFFEYVRVGGSDHGQDRDRIDVAVLDMNHSWPNVGHDSLVHAVIDAAEGFRGELAGAGVKVRVLSYDVRRTLRLPDSPNGRFQLYLGTGGPGHLDPRENDGIKEVSQGIRESDAWQTPLFRLYDSILASDTAAMLAVCHSFGLMCRWSGVARAVLRGEKSNGMPENILTEAGVAHPWFSRFAAQLPDHRHFRVVDNRLFDLVADRIGAASVIAVEDEASGGLTMVELARGADGVPRIFGVNHHPEIIDREHIMAILEEKRSRGEVSDEWYRERAMTMRDLFHGESERQSRLTSEFTLLGPLRHHLGKLIRERVGASCAARV